MIVYLLSQRRAAVVALIAGLIILGLSLFWTRRRLFWKVAPVSMFDPLAHNHRNTAPHDLAADFTIL